MADASNKAFTRCLKDFHNDLTPWKDGAWKDEVRIEIPDELTPQSFMVFIALVQFGAFDWWGKSEKTAWEIPITFKGIPFLLSHRKFGFRVSGLRGRLPDAETTKLMLVRLKQLIRIADKMIEPLVTKQIEDGNVTIVNSLALLTAQYDFFRKKAKQFFSKRTSARVLKKNGEAKAARLNSNFKFELEGSYYAAAMIDAYFSRLEHLLVVVLPFAGFDPKNDNLQRIIGSFWSDKYKRALDIQSDAKAKEFYDRLIDIKEKYRNPLSHGLFKKDGASLFFHMPVVGAIPIYLSQFDPSVHYSVFPLVQSPFREICELFDSFDKYLRSGTLRYAIKFAEAGLDVAFDAKSRATYGAAMKSTKSFEEFVQYRAHLSDIHRNMDW